MSRVVGADYAKKIRNFEVAKNKKSTNFAQTGQHIKNVRQQLKSFARQTSPRQKQQINNKNKHIYIYVYRMFDSRAQICI